MVVTILVSSCDSIKDPISKTCEVVGVAIEFMQVFINFELMFLGNNPITTLLTNLSTSAQTPNLRASLGHFPADGGYGVGVGLGLGPGQVSHELTSEKKRMFRAKKRATEAFLDPISMSSIYIDCLSIIVENS